MRAHRLRRALHRHGDTTHLEVQLEGCSARWQPACTVDEAALAAYFAHGADARIQQRRQRRFQLRAQGSRGKRLRKETSFMASWSSAGPRAQSDCSTHKESAAHMTAAARTAGFLTAVSASGVIVDVDELIGAESLSQRYRFLALLVARWPSLKVVVHDDACHLRLLAEARGSGTDVATRMATQMACIADEYHSSGHVGQWCSQQRMPGLPGNKSLLAGFPTNICEIVNSELSPLGHTVHHMGRWSCQLLVREAVDVLNMKNVQQLKAKRSIAARKAARRVVPP